MTEQNCGGRESVEIGILVAPWPKWIDIDTLDTQASVVIIAKRILSAYSSDGAEHEYVSRLLERLTAQETVVNAWLLADRSYLAHVDAVLGQEAIKARITIGGTTESRRSFDLMVLSLMSADLAQVGLPLRFLGSFDDKDRIGIAPTSTESVDFAHFPTYNEMLAEYELVVLAGGEHNSDCIIASKRMDNETLLNRVKKAAIQLDREVNCLDLIQGEAYERLHERTL